MNHMEWKSMDHSFKTTYACFSAPVNIPPTVSTPLYTLSLSLSLSQIGTISIKRHISHHNNNDYNLAPFLSLLAVYY